MEQKTLVIDASELDNFELCAQRWHLVNHRLFGESTTAMEEGSLLHDLLEDYYTRILDGTEIDQDQIEDIVERGKVKSLDYENLQIEEIGEIVFQFREYCSHYEGENIIPIFVEKPFLKLLHEDESLRVFLSGKPDLVFRYSQSPSLCVMDHKKSRRDFTYSALRNQFLLYSVAMETDTFLVNKVGFQKTYTREKRFKREAFIYSEEIKEEWKNDVINRAREMVLYQETGHFPRNRTSCEKFNGCYFQRYCATKPSAREFLIGTEYMPGKKWDVTESLGDKNND